MIRTTCNNFLEELYLQDMKAKLPTNSFWAGLNSYSEVFKNRNIKQYCSLWNLV